jgi:hypothetical protein
MRNEKTLKLSTGQTIPDRFNAFFAKIMPKRYVGKGKHNPEIRDMPLWLLSQFRVALTYRRFPIA